MNKNTFIDKTKKIVLPATAVVTAGVGAASTYAADVATSMQTLGAQMGAATMSGTTQGITGVGSFVAGGGPELIISGILLTIALGVLAKIMSH